MVELMGFINQQTSLWGTTLWIFVGSLWIPSWVAPLAPGFMIRARPALRSLGWDSDMPRDWITHNWSAPKRPWKPPGVHRVMCPLKCSFKLLVPCVFFCVFLGWRLEYPKGFGVFPTKCDPVSVSLETHRARHTFIRFALSCFLG